MEEGKIEMEDQMMNNKTLVEKPKSKRGFACMPKDVVAAIARKGGKAAHAAGTAHEFTSEEAQIAGRKGGQASHARRKASTSGGPDSP